jgi:hypothetical protein
MAYPLDVKLEAPKSTKCKRKYCDITGFEAPYVDPKTHLRFYNFKIFYKVKACTDEDSMYYENEYVYKSSPKSSASTCSSSSSNTSSNTSSSTSSDLVVTPKIECTTCVNTVLSRSSLPGIPVYHLLL